MLAFCLVVIGVGAVAILQIFDDTQPARFASSATINEPLVASVDADDPAAVVAPESSDAGVASPPVAPFVQASLVGKELTLSGAVPSEELKAGLLQAAGLAYSPFVVSEVQVDQSLPSPEWLAVTPRAVILLSTITEGTLVVSEGRISVTGRTGSDEHVADLEQYLTEATGLPVDMGDVEVTGLREPVYVIAGAEGRVALSGALPNEEVRMGLFNAATTIYGEANVLDASTVDPGVDTGLWMFNPEALIGVLAAFSDFELRLVGGTVSATLSGGATFDVGSAEITPALSPLLDFGIVVLSRDPAMVVAVEGHTDSDGPDELNLQLSQARADAVAAYYAGGGVDPARITATGVGEAEPIAPNDTSEGRAKNRRVEFNLESN